MMSLSVEQIRDVLAAHFGFAFKATGYSKGLTWCRYECRCGENFVLRGQSQTKDEAHRDHLAAALKAALDAEEKGGS